MSHLDHPEFLDKVICTAAFSMGDTGRWVIKSSFFRVNAYCFHFTKIPCNRKVRKTKIWCLHGICLSIKSNSLTWRNISLFTGFDSCCPLRSQILLHGIQHANATCKWNLLPETTLKMCYDIAGHKFSWPYWDFSFFFCNWKLQNLPIQYGTRGDHYKCCASVTKSFQKI